MGGPLWQVHDRRMDTPQPDVRRPIPAVARVAAVVVGIPVGYAAFVTVLGFTASPRVGAGECAGIGFGCTLAPRDWIWLGGAYLGLFVVPVLWVVTGIVIWVRRRRRSSR